MRTNINMRISWGYHWANLLGRAPCPHHSLHPDQAAELLQGLYSFAFQHPSLFFSTLPTVKIGPAPSHTPAQTSCSVNLSLSPVGKNSSLYIFSKKTIFLWVYHGTTGIQASLSSHSLAVTGSKAVAEATCTLKGSRNSSGIWWVFLVPEGPDNPNKAERWHLYNIYTNTKMN